MQSGPILFLDFDGVLHPEGCSQRHLLMHVPTLASILERHAAKIVVSSTWRLTRSLSTLRILLGPELGPLVIGKTGLYASMSMYNLPDSLRMYQRHMECVGWMRKHHSYPERWLALDDRAYLFSPFCPNVLECNARTGLDVQTLQLLDSRLALL